MKTNLISIQIVYDSGAAYLDIRRYITSPSGPIPTARGVKIPADKIAEVVKALEALESQSEGKFYVPL